MSRLRALAELLRISLAPTVVADLCAGVALYGGGAGGGAAVLRLAAIPLLLFCGGMALNGWVDREEDRVSRPRRPLPSGAIAPGFALALAVVALIAAPAVAAIAGRTHARDVAAWTAGLAAAIALYHTPLKKSSLAGPLLLGAIRGGDLLLGAVGVAGIGPGVAAAWPAALVYGAYVAGASGVAHEEDRAPRMGRVRVAVLLAFAAIALNGGLAWLRADGATQLPIVIVLMAAWHGWKIKAALHLLRPGAPGMAPLAAYAGLLLAGMPLLPAVAAFGAAAPDLGLIAFAAFWVVFALVRIVPPT